MFGWTQHFKPMLYNTLVFVLMFVFCICSYTVIFLIKLFLESMLSFPFVFVRGEFVLYYLASYYLASNKESFFIVRLVSRFSWKISNGRLSVRPFAPDILYIYMPDRRLIETIK